MKELKNSGQSARRFVGVWVATAILLASGRAHAVSQVLSGTMSGAQETPPNASAATGTCTATVDSSTLVVTFSGTFSGLGMSASAAALRGLSGPGTTGPALLAATSLSAATSGTFAGSGTLTPEQMAGLLAAKTYCEIGDAAFPSGELRGPLSLPAPAPGLTPGWVAWLALALGVAGFGSFRSRPRRARHEIA